MTKEGLFFFGEKFNLKDLVEKPAPAQLEELRKKVLLKPGSTAWYNADIYIFRASIFDFTARLQKSPRGEYKLTDAISAVIASGQRLAGLAIQGRPFIRFATVIRKCRNIIPQSWSTSLTQIQR